MLSISKTELEQRLIDRASACLADIGYRVVDLDCVLTGHRMVRLFIERAAEPNASIEDCARVSEALGDLIESEIGGGPCDLEVSSPGLERRLRTWADFAACVKREIQFKLVSAFNGQIHFRGTLKSMSATGIVIVSSGTSVEVPIGRIKKANVIWEEQKHAI